MTLKIMPDPFFAENGRFHGKWFSMCPFNRWVAAAVLFFIFGVSAGAWNVTDQTGGTNYIATPGGYTNNVYFSSYLLTNDTASAYSNIWVMIGTFTNGVGAPNIGLGGRIVK